ncbi:MAG: DUF6789 family protein [Alphaproteobacteria bacterium]
MESSVFVDTGKGIIAGIVGALALALLMFVKDAAGLAPEINLLASYMKIAGTDSQVTGWIAFFVINALIVGAVFAALDAHLERPEGAEELVRGALFGVGLWLLAMIFLMPMAGAGAFGMRYGITAPAVIFIAQIIQGMVMGGVYGALRPEPVPT